jgi:MYXO-CTERM domain-containing protein
MTFRRFRTAAFLGLAWLAPSAAGAATLMGEAADAFDVTVAGESLSQPTDIAELPDGRLVITERLGGVVVVQPDGTQIDSGTITVQPDFQEQGLLGVVADPDFATNNMLYFYASVGNDLPNKHKVYKIPLGADGMLASSRDTIISMGLLGSDFGNHNGGGMIIHDGLLYLSVGDSGHNATPPTNRLGTCLNSANGKILRVALDGSTPMTNPLVGQAMVTGCDDWDGSLAMMAPDTRIFSWGFRNPYRFWIDSQTKRMWIGDVGEMTREEVSVSAPIDSDTALAGEHFGWPFREGTTNYSQSWQPSGACTGVTPSSECIGPVYDYETGGDRNACVIGGLIPDGCGWADPWNSRYFFGDNSSGRIWTLQVNATRDGIMGNTATQIGTTQGIGSFRMNSKGGLFLVEVSGGVVSVLTPKGLDPSTCPGSSGGMGGAGGMSGAGGTAGDATGGIAGAQGGAAQGGAGSGGAPPSGAGPGGAGAGPMTGGSGPAGGMSGSGGAPGTGGGSGAATTGGKGGTPSAGGANPMAGSTSSGGSAEPPEEGGCGCRVAGAGGGLGGFLAVASGLALYALRRSRKRRREDLH